MALELSRNLVNPKDYVWFKDQKKVLVKEKNFGSDT